ncbi:DUF397 domain-containing protein [Streptomyces sp. ISL-99]|uniref:DUF397 domain-containing protein n=1 Tax=Streptomyces sp. ISL-99 TaxID=2819193 RepID=UPI001BE99D1D|nr:DUF397 domain-containing protein [Streptomyces sp. ISL-99]MBT2528845.1 DUF397 domain-containing protein [Streptomyces sp. ISL-99]
MSVEEPVWSVPEWAWFKSSYSSGEGGQCIEVAMTWCKSSYSAGNGGECVEVATCPSAVHVRDSKVTAGPMLTLGTQAWGAFVGFAAEVRRA